MAKKKVGILNQTRCICGKVFDTDKGTKLVFFKMPVCPDCAREDTVVVLNDSPDDSPIIKQ